jgi:hypothetical protein
MFLCAFVICFYSDACDDFLSSIRGYKNVSVLLGMSPVSPGKRTITAHTTSLESFMRRGSRAGSAIASGAMQSTRMISRMYRLRFS